MKELGDGENFLSFCYGASNYGIIKRIVNILRMADKMKKRPIATLIIVKIIFFAFITITLKF